MINQKKRHANLSGEFVKTLWSTPPR